MRKQFNPNAYRKRPASRKAGSFVQVDAASIDLAKNNTLSWQSLAQAVQSGQELQEALNNPTDCISTEPVKNPEELFVSVEEQVRDIDRHQRSTVAEDSKQITSSPKAKLPARDQGLQSAHSQVQSHRHVQAASKNPAARPDATPGIVSNIKIPNPEPGASAPSSQPRHTLVPKARNILPSSDQPEVQQSVKAMLPRVNKKSNGDRSDRLKLLQNDSLRKITRKSAARRENDKNSSVSMRDLDLARTPVDMNDPASSARRWAPDSMLCESNEPTLGLTPQLKELSMIPLASTPEPSQIQSAKLPSTKSLHEGRNSRWAAKDEMKAEKIETGSNEWGSVMPSDATHSTNSSDKSFGKLLQRRGAEGCDESIVDWEGKMMPPPADWEERRRYNNNNPDFKDRFRHYIHDLEGRFANGIPISQVSINDLQKYHLHPDGISLQRRTETIGLHNAAKYGYSTDVNDVVKYAASITEGDYEMDCKLDSGDEGNACFDRDETTHSLVTNWNKHLVNARGERVNTGPSSQQPKRNRYVTEQPKEVEFEPSPLREDSSLSDEGEDGAPLTKPMLNIYLRPATIADFSEMTRIYNWYVENGSQPAELYPVSEESMKFRMDVCDESRLPFLVAAKMSQKGAKPIPSIVKEQYGLPTNHKAHSGLTRIEKLAGFCCASDFTQPDYVEHITVDIELYVDAQYQKMGVGKSLMDKMLEICDRSHRLTIDVPFHCDREIRHKYGPGGVRELHKMIVQLRKWHKPVPAKIDVKGNRKSRKLAFAKTREDEYNRWLREWFEAMGFEVEASLKKMGAKNGRYIDLVYFTRETCWQPPEGGVPGPLPEFLGPADEEEE